MSRSAAVLLGVLILVWGANWPVLKVALEYISPLWLAALRLGIAAVCLFAIVAATRGRVRLPSRQDMPLVLSISLLQMALFTALINFGLLYVEAGRSAILSYTTPLWVTPAAALLLNERLTPPKVAGVVLGLLGVGVMFNPFSFDWRDDGALFGNGLLLLSALAWAIAIVHTRGHRWRDGPLDLAPWQMLIGFLPVLVTAFAVDGPPSIVWSVEMVAAMIYIGPIATAFAFWAVVTVTKMLPAITTSLSFLGVPVAGLLFSAAFLGERLSIENVLGLGLIAAGMAVVTLAAKEQSGAVAVGMDTAREGDMGERRDDTNRPARPRPDSMNPGDDAPAGTPGTGEDICPECHGTGKLGTQPCGNCGGTGIIIEGIGGA